MRAKIKVTLKSGILDPQGKTVQKAIHSLGFENIEEVRMGKYIEIKLSTNDSTEADKEIRQICAKLLANPIIEDFTYSLEQE